MAVILFIVMSKGCDSSSSSKGSWGSDGYYNPSDAEMEQTWNDVNEWMQENWN